MSEKRPILSKAESYNVPVVRKNPPPSDKKLPYSYSKAKTRLSVKLDSAITQAKTLPTLALPNDNIVTKLVLHPSFLAKSFYPDKILSEYDLENLGSKEVFIEPEEKITKKQKEGKSSTSLYFVSGKKSSFERLLKDINSDNLNDKSKEDLIKLEDISFFEGAEKIAPSNSNKPKGTELSYEVVIHTSNENSSIIDCFVNYIESLEGHVFKEKSRSIKGLTFCFVKINSDLVQQLAEFSFVRVVRPIAEIKLSDRVGSFTNLGLGEIGNTHQETNIDRNRSNIAIFDGGLLPEDYSNPKVRYFDLTGQVKDHPANLLHGSLVTSAIVYGEADEFEHQTQPILNVDHFKVFCSADEADILLVDVLDRIIRVLKENPYKFINISLGPELPCSDSEPNLWTATLDELASSGKMLIVVAVGNSGDSGLGEEFTRIQPPADILNGLSIGAADSKGSSWKRSAYSSIGPGRRPGFTKPDALYFGGNATLGGEKVKLFTLGDFELKELYGTSYAAPLVLRQAAIIDNLTGGKFDVATIRALLIHSTNRDSYDRKQCGWGRISSNIEDMLYCSGKRVTFIYQGQLNKASGIRAPIPWPDDIDISGKVTLEGTVCFYSDVDQQHTANYTKSGLEITFRPNCNRFKVDPKTGKQSAHANTASFFNKVSIVGKEGNLRIDDHKWETCYSVSPKPFKVSSLDKPVFDIKYLTRDEGHSLSPYEMRNLKPLPYSLIVTIELEKEFDLYSSIVSQYENLTPIDIEVENPIVIKEEVLTIEG